MLIPYVPHITSSEQPEKEGERAVRAAWDQMHASKLLDAWSDAVKEWRAIKNLDDRYDSPATGIQWVKEYLHRKREGAFVHGDWHDQCYLEEYVDGLKIGGHGSR